MHKQNAQKHTVQKNKVPKQQEHDIWKQHEGGKFKSRKTLADKCFKKENNNEAKLIQEQKVQKLKVQE